TGEGTSNLVKTRNACLKSQGIAQGPARIKTAVAYSPATHRTLLALRCAKNQRPFNSVADEDYLLEVSMLRPNTVVPKPITVSRDINKIYIEMSKLVREYLSVS
ncbi:hypothetical protein GALMADRAFT_35039, partial [Galerina marginata CBS 339.88]